jgi:hypothetical protein
MENRCAPLKNGGWQNARATGGPGILPATNLRFTGFPG